MNEHQLKLAEEALRASEERFRGTFENAAVGIVHNDSAGRFLLVNDKFCEIVGYSREELLQKTLFEIIHPEELAAHVALYAACFQNGQPPVSAMVKRYLRKDGSTVWVEVFASFQPDKSGRPRYAIGVVQDISDRKRLEEELRQANALLQGFADGTQDAVYVKDLAGRYLMFNAAARQLVGKPIAEVIGSDDTAIFDPEGAHVVMAHDRQVIDTGTAASYEHELSASGVTRTYLSSKAPYRDGQGNVIGLIGICHDITERKRLEQELHLATARLELALRGSNIGIWDIELPDGDLRRGRIHYVNIWEQFGYECPDSWIDLETGMRLIHPEDRPAHDEATRKYLAGETGDFEVEIRVRHKDGSTRWLISRGFVVRDTNGAPIRFLGTGIDITDRKRIEEALRESEERFRQLAENVRGVFWLQEAGWGRLLYISPAYEEIWGRTCLSLYEQPRSWIDTVHLEDRDSVFASLEQQQCGISTETEFRITRPDGSIRWVRCGAFPLKNQKGEVSRTAGLVDDITERKQFEAELRSAKDAAEAANRAKDDFLANVSHEIRTPMNAIIGMTELVLDTPLDEDQRQGLKTVKSAADSLLGIINDLLDFSKIEAGKLELAHADFSLRAAVGDTLRALAVRAHKKGLELIYQVQPDVPDGLIGDAGRLRQVLLNLAGNAVKFTDEGEVVVQVEIAQNDDRPPSDEATEVCLKFSVRDTGIGIPQAQQQRIFLAFEQEDISTTRKYGGTGLGLTIAARLVALMGGTIHVKSALGEGSTFSFTSRFGRPPHQSESTLALSADPAAARLHNLPVLVVDDNATNRHILEEWLRDWQMEPTTVAAGMAAMDSLWHRAANGRPHALVLLDSRMPDTDGLTVATMIRERAELASTRIILLTSGERTGDPARIRELRIDAQLLKPVQQDELLETIYRVMSRSAGNASLSAWSAPRQKAGKTVGQVVTPVHILVGEDNELSAQVLEQALVRQGHHVRVAANGRDVLALAEKGGIDLLLLDVHMPELDGFQVVHAVRQRESTTGGHLPIIALTARSRKEDRERCLAAGMDEFQTKPIRPVDLFTVIDRVLRMYPPRSRNLLDARTLLAACDNDATLLRKMCQTLNARVPEFFAAMRDALRDHDAPRLRETAHKFCGMLSEFSTTAGNLAGDLEDLAASTRLDNCDHILQQLETMTGKLVELTNRITIEQLHRQVDGLQET